MTPEQFAVLRESQARVEVLVAEGFRRVDDRLSVLDNRANDHSGKIRKLELARNWALGVVAAVAAIYKIA